MFVTVCSVFLSASQCISIGRHFVIELYAIPAEKQATLRHLKTQLISDILRTLSAGLLLSTFTNLSGKQNLVIFT